MESKGIEAIKPLWDTMGLSGLGETGKKDGENDIFFADIFQSAVDTVRETEAVKNDKEYLLAVGELDNPTELSIASTKFAASVDMLIQLRNKALDAYSELMRISL